MNNAPLSNVYEKQEYLKKGQRIFILVLILNFSMLYSILEKQGLVDDTVTKLVKQTYV